MSLPTPRTFHAHCHCNQISLFISIPESSLPLSAHTCHCKTCRHTSGTLAVFLARLPCAPTPDPRGIKGLTAYTAIVGSDVQRFFCERCGTHMLSSFGEEGREWAIATTTVEGGDESVFEFGDAIFVGDSRDGGISEWLGSETRKWDTRVGVGLPLEDDSWKREVVVREDEETVDVHCHCNGVVFTLHRPDYHGDAFKKDFPDLLLPPEEASKRDVEQEQKDGNWWIANDRSKCWAGACFCTSCRLSSGSEQMQWAFVPTAFLTLPDGSPYTRVFGTLKEFESSPDIFRRFCGTCGASMFWHNIAERPLMIDVAVGVIDAPSGARAEGWLEYFPKANCAGDAANKKLANDLQTGVTRWHSSLEKKA